MLCTATQSAKSLYIMFMNLACPPGSKKPRGHCQLSEHKKVDAKESAGAQMIQTIQVTKKERNFKKWDFFFFLLKQIFGVLFL